MSAFSLGVERSFERLSDRLGEGGILGQAVNVGQTTSSAVVPEGAAYAFIEALGRGGRVSASSSAQRAGGGAGNDAIIAVEPGQVLVSSTNASSDTVGTTIKRNDVTLLVAASGKTNTPAGAAGKNPGGDGETALGGAGGGRFGGPGAAASGAPVPLGAGVYATSSAWEGSGFTCMTFFARYDDALAFAKSVYGGVWAP